MADGNFFCLILPVRCAPRAYGDKKKVGTGGLPVKGVRLKKLVE
jgi:hypothetical protein